MPTYMTQLLQELGWDDGTRVPLASAENKALENLLVSRQSEIQRLKEAISLQDQKQADLDRYRENITTEYNENSKLLVAHKQQLDEELKIKRVANVERDKLNMEINQMKKRCADIKERIDRVQGNMSHVLKKADVLKGSVCGDRMALKEWLEALERSACDIETIEKYTKQDNSKAKDLETKRQKLKQEHDRMHDRLTQLCGNLSAEERACERISNQVTVAIVERRRLIDTWSGAVENLRQRDKDIKHMQEDYELLREESYRKAELTREKEQFLQQQLGNNAEAENEVAVLAQELANIRQRAIRLTDNNKTLDSDMKSLQRMLANISQELQRVRNENKHIIEEQHKKDKALDELKDKISSLKQKHAESMDKSKSSADRAKELEDMLNEEEKYSNNLKVNHQRSMHCSFLEQQKLMALKNDEKLMTMQMKGCKSAVSKLDTKAYQIEKELLLQKESLYGINYSIETTGVRIARMEGDIAARACDAVLDEKVEQRERAAAEHGTRVALLQGQVRRLDEDMRRLTRAIADKQADHDDLRSRLKGQGLGLAGQQQQLREARQECRAMRVEESLMRLRVAHAERAVARLDDRAYTLEKQRLEVDAAMNERQVEISIRRDILNVQKRALMEDSSKLRLSIRERAGRIEQLKKRYDIFIASLGKDDSGEQLSVTYFKIKFAQEKASLQQQGDELDMEIRRSEQEIASMEASLHIMDMAHKQFVKHVSVVKDDDPQMQVIEELRVEYYRLKEALDALRAQMRTHDGRVVQLNATLTQLGEKCATLRQREAEVENDLDNLVEQLQKQESKLDHARSTVKTYSKRAHRLVSETDLWQMFELEMSNRSYLEAQYSALRQLLDVARVSPEVADTLAAYMKDQNIRGLVQKQHKRSLNFIDSILMGSVLHQTAEITASPSESVVSSHEETPSVGRQSTIGGSGYTRRLNVFRSELSKKLQEPCLMDDQSDRGSSRSSLPMKVVSLGLDLEPVKECKTSSNTTP